MHFKTVSFGEGTKNYKAINIYIYNGHTSGLTTVAFNISKSQFIVNLYMHGCSPV